jgi:hypothetical protein
MITFAHAPSQKSAFFCPTERIFAGCFSKKVRKTWLKVGLFGPESV